MSTDLMNEIQESDKTPNNRTYSPRPSTETLTDVSTSSKICTVTYIKVLHGDLNIWIHEARSLPNMDIMSERMRRCFSGCKPPFMKPRKKRGGVHNIITSDPYVSVCLSGATVAQWEEHFVVNVAHPTAMVEFQVDIRPKKKIPRETVKWVQQNQQSVQRPAGHEKSVWCQPREKGYLRGFEFVFEGGIVRNAPVVDTQQRNQRRLPSSKVSVEALVCCQKSKIV